MAYGERPRGQMPDLLAAALTRRCGRSRPLTREHIGLGRAAADHIQRLLWNTVALIGTIHAATRGDLMSHPDDSAAGPMLHGAALLDAVRPWLDHRSGPLPAPTRQARRIGAADVTAIRAATATYCTADNANGDGPADPESGPTPITRTDTASVREAMSWVYPAIDVAGRVLPGMLDRGAGGLLFAGGLSAVRPMPALGNLAVSSAALRNYALTLHAGLAGTGVYAGTLTIGGIIERGDIHRMVTSQPERFGDVGDSSLDPDDIAEAAWRMYTERDRPEATFSAFG